MHLARQRAPLTKGTVRITAYIHITSLLINLIIVVFLLHFHALVPDVLPLSVLLSDLSQVLEVLYQLVPLLRERIIFRVPINPHLLLCQLALSERLKDLLLRQVLPDEYYLLSPVTH